MWNNKSMAVAAPHPKSKSGIGAYTEMVLGAWSEDDEIISLDMSVVPCNSTKVIPGRCPLRSVNCWPEEYRLCPT